MQNSLFAKTPARLAEKLPQDVAPWVGKPYDQALVDGSINMFFAHWLSNPDAEKRARYGYEWLVYATNHLAYPRHILTQFRQMENQKYGLAISETDGI